MDPKLLLSHAKKEYRLLRLNLKFSIHYSRKQELKSKSIFITRKLKD